MKVIILLCLLHVILPAEAQQYWRSSVGVSYSNKPQTKVHTGLVHPGAFGSYGFSAEGEYTLVKNQLSIGLETKLLLPAERIELRNEPSFYTPDHESFVGRGEYWEIFPFVRRNFTLGAQLATGFYLQAGSALHLESRLNRLNANGDFSETAADGRIYRAWTEFRVKTSRLYGKAELGVQKAWVRRKAGPVVQLFVQRTFGDNTRTDLTLLHGSIK